MAFFPGKRTREILMFLSASMMSPATRFGLGNLEAQPMIIILEFLPIVPGYIWRVIRLARCPDRQTRGTTMLMFANIIPMATRFGLGSSEPRTLIMALGF